MTEPTLLVIDDSADFRTLLSEHLSDAGFQVETAPDGRVGLEKIDGGGIDLAIVDLMMPNVNGYEVAGELREREEGHRPPFILVSAYDLGRWSAEQLGAVAGFGKPLDFEALETTVREVLDARAAA